MATPKTAKKNQKESRFYIAKTLGDAREKIEKTVKTYNDKYVKKQLETGREFITELKADPVKRIDDLIDDGRDAIKRVRSERMDTLQKKINTTQKEVRQKMDRITKETRTVYKGIGNDAKLIVEDMLALGKKSLAKMPLKKSIEKRISHGIDAIPSKLNIPSKEEIDNLVKGLDGVSKRLDALNKEYARA
jgi:polyhydroxyalkanoate synthesis regulator phasin